MKWCLGMSPNESFSFSGHREDFGFIHDCGDQAFQRCKWEVIVSRTMDGNWKGEDSGGYCGNKSLCACVCAWGEERCASLMLFILLPVSRSVCYFSYAKKLLSSLNWLQILPLSRNFGKRGAWMTVHACLKPVFLTWIPVCTLKEV